MCPSSPVDEFGRRVQISGELSTREIRALVKNSELEVVQFSKPLAECVWPLLNEELFATRPEVGLRAYGFCGSSCDLSFLSTLENLRDLAIEDVQEIENIEAVTRLPRLRRLSVGVFGIESFAFLEHVPAELEALRLHRTRSKRPDLAPLERFAAIETLYLEGQQKNIDVLAGLPTLRDVTLRSVTAPDLGFLRQLKKMWSLAIKLGGSSDLGALAGHPGIKYLELWQIRGLSDLSVLSTLPNLQNFLLQNLPKVRTLPDFRECTQLRRVHIDSMLALETVSSLATAPALREFIHVASHLGPEAYVELLDHPCLRNASAGFGSVKKNERFRKLAAERGVKEYRYRPFEYAS